MTRHWRRRSKAQQFVAVQDVMETATTEIADVVLPAQAFTEREGTFTSGERRVQRFYVGCAGDRRSKADFAITAEIARTDGRCIWKDTLLRVVFDHPGCSSVTSFAGLDYAKACRSQAAVADCRAQRPVLRWHDL